MAGAQPTFQANHASFSKLVGDKPEIKLCIEKDYAFAHEAGVFFKDTGDVWVTSNRIHLPGGGQKIIISKLNLNEEPYTAEEIETEVKMGNGGIKYKDGVLFCEQGTMERAGGIYWMEAKAPYKVTTVVDSFQGRPFNSPNDVVVHEDGSIWFTDPIYGYMQGFKPKPRLPCQVYRFDPATKAIRAMADGFERPNGICFSPDQSVVYVTDTAHSNGDGTKLPEKFSTIYAFDVIIRAGEPFLANRRLFAFADTGAPDGIKVDEEGNVYSGCGDGIHVWSPGGVFLGKIVIPGGVANFVFCKPGEIIALNETRLYHVKISPSSVGVLVEV